MLTVLYCFAAALQQTCSAVLMHRKVGIFRNAIVVAFVLPLCYAWYAWYAYY